LYFHYYRDTKDEVQKYNYASSVINERLGILETLLDMDLQTSWPTSGRILKDLFKINGVDDTDAAFGAVSDMFINNIG
jgi:hypothetical protein